MSTYAEWKGWQDTTFGQVSPEEWRYFPGELAASGIGSVRGLRIAELGFGNGSFAAWTREQGGHWTGRESIPDLQDRARAAGFAVLDIGQALVAGCGAGVLDLVVAFDVIEHLTLPEIRDFLADAHASLCPGGRVVLRMPSGDSPFSGAIFRGDLTHRTLLGSSAVRQLALESGFVAEQVRPPYFPWIGNGFVATLRRILARALQFVVHPLVKHGLMGNRDAVVSPNLVAVLRKAGQPA